MVTYSTSELSRRSGDIIADALRKPVTIMQRNKPDVTARVLLRVIERDSQPVARALTGQVTADVGWGRKVMPVSKWMRPLDGSSRERHTDGVVSLGVIVAFRTLVA